MNAPTTQSASRSRSYSSSRVSISRKERANRGRLAPIASHPVRDRTWEAAYRFVNTPIWSELGYARQADTRAVVHSSDEISEAAAADLDVWIQEQDIAPARVREGHVVGRREADVRTAPDLHRWVFVSNCLWRPVGGSAVDNQELSRDVTQVGLRRLQGRQGHLTPIVRYDDHAQFDHDAPSYARCAVAITTIKPAKKKKVYGTCGNDRMSNSIPVTPNEIAAAAPASAGPARVGWRARTTECAVQTAARSMATKAAAPMRPAEMISPKYWLSRIR